MSIYNCIAQVVPSILPIGSIMVRGITSCMVTGSLSASLGLINNHVVLVSNIADIENPWVLIGKYKKPYCILMSLSFNQSIFSAYLESASYISFSTPLDSYLYYSALPSYYYARASSKVFAYCTEAYVVHPDSIWLCVQPSCRCNM